MPANEAKIKKSHQQVLWACYDYWQEETSPENERVICFSWVRRRHEAKFGSDFHHSQLQQLAELGFLKKEDTSHRGHRRYYSIVDPEKVRELLEKGGLI